MATEAFFADLGEGFEDRLEAGFFATTGLAAGTAATADLGAGANVSFVADLTTAGTAVGVGIDFGAEACSVDFFPVVAAAGRTGGTGATVSGLEGGTLGALSAAGFGAGVRGFSFGSAALGNDGGTGDGFGVFAAGGTEGFTGAFATGAGAGVAAAGAGLV